jgi:hypothetical protein
LIKGQLLSVRNDGSCEGYEREFQYFSQLETDQRPSIKPLKAFKLNIRRTKTNQYVIILYILIYESHHFQQGLLISLLISKPSVKKALKFPKMVSDDVNSEDEVQEDNEATLRSSGEVFQDEGPSRNESWIQNMVETVRRELILVTLGNHSAINSCDQNQWSMVNGKTSRLRQLDAELDSSPEFQHLKLNCHALLKETESIERFVHFANSQTAMFYFSLFKYRQSLERCITVETGISTRNKLVIELRRRMCE